MSPPDGNKPIDETHKRVNLKDFATGISATDRTYWDRHFWATDYGAWSPSNITDDMVQEYLEHHRSKEDGDSSDFILE